MVIIAQYTPVLHPLSLQLALATFEHLRLGPAATMPRDFVQVPEGPSSCQGPNDTLPAVVLLG